MRPAAGHMGRTHHMEPCEMHLLVPQPIPSFGGAFLDICTVETPGLPIKISIATGDVSCTHAKNGSECEKMNMNIFLTDPWIQLVQVPLWLELGIRPPGACRGDQQSEREAEIDIFPTPNLRFSSHVLSGLARKLSRK